MIKAIDTLRKAYKTSLSNSKRDVLTAFRHKEIADDYGKILRLLDSKPIEECPECGELLFATNGKITCSTKCRMRMHRNKNK